MKTGKTSEEIANYYLDKEYEERHNIKTSNKDSVNTNNSLQLTSGNHAKKMVKGYDRRLTKDELSYILQSSSAFISNQEQSNTLNCNYNTIIHTQQKHQKEISRLRELWLSKLSNEPFSHKRIRLQQYQTLYQQMLDVYNQCSTINEYATISKRLESLLDKSRLEIEGNKININQNINVKYDDVGLIEKSKEIIDLVEYEEVE